MNEQEFHKRLLLRAIARGASSLNQIVADAGGVYPAEVKRILRELSSSGQVESIGPDGEGYRIVPISARNSGKKGSVKNNSPVLPDPHPLDYDWRFEPTTAYKLAETMLKETALGGSILLFGVPSVFLQLTRLRTSVPVTLVEQNAALVRHLEHIRLPSMKAVTWDLMSGDLWKSPEPVQVVLCDPPWYVEHYASFLAQASKACEIGGSVYVSMLQPATRPGALSDRLEVINIANQLGLYIHSVIPDVLRYQTPEFEQTSLQAEDIKIDSGWRRGDLVIFRKAAEPTLSALTRVLDTAKPATQEEHQWDEVILDRKKIKLRKDYVDTNVPPEIFSIEKNDLLPTVSRRYSGRSKVDLWLWDNRVFGIRNKGAMWYALNILAGKNLKRKPYVSSVHVNRAVAMLEEQLQRRAAGTQNARYSGLQRLKKELEEAGSSLSVKQLEDLCLQCSVRAHVAVMNQPYLDKVVTKEKTIESRFAKNKTAPYEKVQSGDILILKESAGPILALAEVEKTEFHGPLLTSEVAELMTRYKSRLLLEDDFRQKKKDSKYATLLHLRDVVTVEPINVKKSDRRAWIVLNHEQQELF